MSNRLAALLATFLIASPAVLPFVVAEPAFDGDVVVNGAFRDARKEGHPLKLYNNADNVFVAYDWTTAAAGAARVEVVEDGLLLKRVAGEETTVQQHFNGSEAPARPMTFHGLAVTGRGVGGDAQVRVDIRYVDAEGAKTQASKSFVLPSTTATFRASAGEMALTPIEPRNLLSVKVWLEGSNDAVLERVQVHATNGVDPRTVRILPAGDDEVQVLGASVVQSPGADGRYSWRVDLVEGIDQTFPLRGAVLCVYAFEDALADDTAQGDGPGQLGCASATLTGAQTAPYLVADGDGYRFDVPVDLVRPEGSASGAFFVWASAKYEGVGATYPGPSAWMSAWYNVAREASSAPGRSVSPDWQFSGTPIVFDRDANGVPDGVETDETDGHAVVITPRLATATPVATVLTPSVAGDYLFDVQVYRYPKLADAPAAGAVGAPMTLDARGVAFALFDAGDLLQPDPAPGWVKEPLWRAGAEHVAQLDATTYRVTVPSTELPANVPVGAWAFYDVDGTPERRTVAEPAIGPSDTAFDFYSSLKVALQESVAADALRSVATPLVLDAASLTRDATLVVRMDPSDDQLTPLDGTLVVDDLDGYVTFDYAMILPEGRTHVPADGGHGFALYDAAGLSSDGFAPGASGLEHAEHVAQGVLQSNGWYRVHVPVSAFDDAKGPVAAWAYVDDHGVQPTLSRSGYYNYAKPAVAALSTSAAQASLYPATPIVVLDEALGIPKALASTLNAQPAALFTVANPLVNPGFELDLLVEGAKDDRDAASGTMTTPPWFFRLDDKGTQQPTNPRSTHEVVSGEGPGLDRALRVRYHAADAGKGLMLGQLFGADQGTQALVWEDATGASFDAKLVSGAPVQLTATARYVDATGAVRMASASQIVGASLGWQRVDLTFAQPADGRLLGFYLSFAGMDAATLLLDNVALRGARTVLGDARGDLTDGYAMIIEPQHLTGNVQKALQGADGAYFVYEVHAVDYTRGVPRALPLDETGGRAFALRTQDAQTSTGVLLPLRGETERVAAVVPADEVPAPLAAPWAFFDAEPAHQTLGTPLRHHAVSGYHSPVKNAIAGSTLADQLDYAATPVAFDASEPVGPAAQQVLSLVAVPGGHEVKVTAAMPFVETTTLTVQLPGQEPQAYPVTLDSDAGNVVAMPLLPEDTDGIVLTTADTRFSRGAAWAGNLPPVLSGVQVSPDPVYSDSTVTITADASDPDGGAPAFAWTLDGQPVPVAARSFLLTADVLEAATGSRTLVVGRTYEVGVTVRDAKGAETAGGTSFTVEGRPTTVVLLAAGTPGYPDAIVGETIVVEASATDPDNAIAGASVSFEPSGGGPSAVVPLALDAATGLWRAEGVGLAPGLYEVRVTATDDVGDVASSNALFLAVRENAAPTVALGGDATLDVFGTLDVASDASDPDGRPLAYAWTLDGAPVGDGPSFAYEPVSADVGTHVLRLTVTDANGATAFDEVALVVDDAVSVALAVQDADAMGETEAVATVLDDRGQPVVGARVTLVHKHDLTGWSQAQVVETDADGVARWTLPKLGPAYLPGDQRVEAHVEADSRAGAPVDDVEVASAVASFGVNLLP